MRLSARIRQLAPPVGLLLVVFLTWEILPPVVGIKPHVFPRLSLVLAAGLEVLPNVWLHLRTTALEAVGGLLLGGGFGLVVGVAMAQCEFLRRMLQPYVVGSNAIPIVAIAPLVVLWLGHGLLSKVAVAAFLCFFPLAVNTLRGLREFNLMYSELFRVYGGTAGQFFWKFQVPNALPYILSGARLSATYSVIGAVVAEFIGADRGLGFAMLQASYNLNSPRLYAYLIIACALGLAMYSAIAFIERHCFRRDRGHDD